MTNELAVIDHVAGVSIYSVNGEPTSFLFKAGMTIDCDGSPSAYGPNNTGLDYTANGGDPHGGKWWGGPTNSAGMPVIQKIYEPKPEFYVSGTSLINTTFPESSQYRYIDSGSIPFFVLPGKHTNHAKLGDVGLCYNVENGHNCYGIYADSGPSNKIGEASIRMAEALKINPDPRKGGTESKIIVYLVFPGSVGKWEPPHQWWQTANRLTKEWGGLNRLKEIAKQL